MSKDDPAGPLYIDAFTFQFQGMTDDELEVACKRYQQRARLLGKEVARYTRRLLGVVALACLSVFGGGAALIWGIGALAPSPAVALWIDRIVIFAAVIAFVRAAPRITTRTEPWAREWRRVGQEHDTAVSAARYAAQLLKERHG